MSNPKPLRKTDILKPGDECNVKVGEFKGHLAKIIDPTVQGPESPFQRKILVEVNGEQVYMLPRFLDVAAWTAPSPQHPVVSAASAPAPIAVTALPGAGPAVPVRAPILGALPDVVHLDHPMFDQYRPNSLLVNEYVNRKMANGMTDTDFLMALFERKFTDGEARNLMLVGDTQSGKTMMVQVLAILAGKRLGLDKPLPVFTLSGSSGVSDFDLFGQPTSFTDEFGVDHIVWLPGVVDLAARYGGILYLDEVNMMAERVTSSLHPLTDDRRSFVNRNKPVAQPAGGFMPEQVKAHEDLWVIGTINPGYKGAGALQEAFTNRFTWVEWGYDQETEDKLVTLSSVRLLGSALREARDAKILGTPIGTSALVECCRNAREFGGAMALALLRAMFTPNERPRVDAIVEDRSIAMLLDDEVRQDGLNITK